MQTTPTSSRTPQFLFIVGAPRSANTATLSTLDGHPEILAWPVEFPYFHYFSRLAKGRTRVAVADINREMLRLFETQLNEKLGQDIGTDGPVFTLGDTIGDLDTKTLVQHLNREPDRQLGAVEYLPYLFDSLRVAHSRYRDRVVKYHAMLVTARGMDWEDEQLFRTSRILFPYRDMMESYASIREKGLRHQSPPDFFAPWSKKGALYWFQSFQRVSQLAERHLASSNFFVLPVRRLRFEPETVMAEMCQFLDVAPHPTLSQMSIAGRNYGGNAHERELNTGTFSPRSSRLSIPLSTFEQRAFGALDLYDFEKRERVQCLPSSIGMAKRSLATAFGELHDAHTSTWKGNGSRSTVGQRLKLAVKLFGLYLVLRGGYLSRLVPRVRKRGGLDSLYQVCRNAS